MTRRKPYLKQNLPPKLTSNAKSYHVVSCILAQKTDKLNIARLACQLKNLGNNALASEAFRDLFSAAPFTERVVWGNSCPKEEAQLGNGDNCYFFKPESLEREISWTILGLRRFKKQLAEFVTLRDQVERHIMLGNYREAKEMLEESVERFGYSVWYYEMRLTISGFQDRVDECYDLLTKVNEAYKKADHLDIVPILVQNLGNRSLSKTPLRYDNMLVSHFKRNQEHGSRLDYYLYRLNYYQYSDMDCLSEVVEMEHIHSAIDRYTMLLYVLRSCYATQQEELQAEYQKLSLRFARSLYKITSDPQLHPFLALADEDNTMSASYFDADFIAILDNYYTGHYDTCANLCRCYLDKDPSNLYVIKIYCRSQMFIGKGFQSLTNDHESLLHIIAFNVYNVMVEKENSIFIERLNSRLKNIYGLRIAAPLDCFVRSELREPHSNMLDYLSMTKFDPFFIQAFDDEKRQIDYLERGLDHIPGSEAVLYRKQCVERNISSDSPVVSYIRDVDTAKITFERGDYTQALEQWKQVLEDNHGSIPTAQTAVGYIFHSLVSLGTEHWQEAVRFYIKCYIENPSFVSKVDTKQFLSDMKQSRYSGLRNDLDLILFVFLNADKYPQKQYVLEQYCSYEHVTYPSQLIGRLGRRDPQKVELFFDILLNDDILYHHYKLRSTIDVLDEKLKIVIFLKSTYPQNKKYADIYTELMHEIVAYRGMVKLDDSKIYVNEDAVMRYELCDIEPLYERLRKQAALARGERPLLVVSNYSFEDPTGIDELLKDAALYSSDAMADVASELFTIIRYAFLKSRFGLGTYLSTRIRHGVFEGEMRSFLERLDLILSTDSGNYVTNSHWPPEYHLDRNSCEVLNRALSQFSQDTDRLISSFKDGVIQIRVDNNDPNGGLFCYDQPAEVISERFLQFESETYNAQDFCHKVIDWLWEITEQCLETVRERVRTELKPQFTRNIQQLEKNLGQIQSHTTFQSDMHTAINKAREELTARITKVENWFYRQEAKPEDFRLSDHIKMAFDTIQKYSPDVNVVPDGKMPQNEPLFRAQYSASMFDLLTIFFSNVFRYSCEEFKRPMLLNVTIEEDDVMHLHLENKLRQDTDEVELNNNFQERINDEKMLQKEKGSGLAKAMNIIRYDFGDQSNTYTIVASEGKCIIDVYIHLVNMIVQDTGIYLNSQY